MLACRACRCSAFTAFAAISGASLLLVFRCLNLIIEIFIIIEQCSQQSEAQISGNSVTCTKIIGIFSKHVKYAHKEMISEYLSYPDHLQNYMWNSQDSDCILGFSMKYQHNLENQKKHL